MSRKILGALLLVLLGISAFWSDDIVTYILTRPATVEEREEYQREMNCEFADGVVHRWRASNPYVGTWKHFYRDGYSNKHYHFDQEGLRLGFTEFHKSGRVRFQTFIFPQV